MMILDGWGPFSGHFPFPDTSNFRRVLDISEMWNSIMSQQSENKSVSLGPGTMA